VKNRILLMLLVFSLTLNLAVVFTVVSGIYKAHRCESGQTCTMLRYHPLYRELLLNEKQEEGVRQVNEVLENQVGPLRKQVRALNNELLTLMKQSGIDRAKVLKKQHEICQIQQQIQGKVLDAVLEHRKVLNETQYERMIGSMSRQLCDGHALKNMGEVIPKSR
jgi:peptidoglycan hydrolase CwlO-like protein